MRIHMFIMSAGMAALACSENTPVDETGAVVIEASTGGLDEDSDGYVVLVDGRSAVTVPNDGVVRVGGLEPGLHDALLQNVAPNCDASPAGAHSFQVAPRDTSEVRFFITCYPTGVMVRTEVEGLDPGSVYAVVIDQQSGAWLIQPGRNLTITGLSPGLREIRLANVPPNCVVTPSTQTVPVVLRSVASVTFISRCSAVRGTLEVRVESSGRDLDLDGVAVTVGGEVLGFAPPTGAVLRWDILPGTREVRLTDVASNCMVVGGDRQAVTITSGGSVRDTTRVSFSVECRRFWGLAFTRQETLAFATADGAIVDLGPAGSHPAWSPDGTRLAWSCGSICVSEMDTGSTVGWHPGNLILDAPAWRPDGAGIAYVATECEYYYYYYSSCDFKGLYRASPNGSNPVAILLAPLVFGATDPAWSPDGSTIVFGCTLVSGDMQKICTVGADGTAFRNLTPTGGHASHPSWSPDGSRIVFATNQFGGREIVTITPDGTDLRRFNPVAQGWSPSWVRDGRILFAYAFGGIAIMNSDGTAFTRLTTTLSDSLPSLRP